MEKLPESGYHNSNKFARIFLESAQAILGVHGLNTILNYCSHSELVGAFPPDDLEREFDFSTFSSINQALEEIYGFRGGRGIALRIGNDSFDAILQNYGAIAGVGEAAFRLLPMHEKVKFGLKAMARIFSEKSDQETLVEEHQDYFCYQVKRCPVCWGRKEAQEPVCYYLVGLLKEGLSWASGGKEFSIKEKHCCAAGDEFCEFIIPKEPNG